MSLKRTILTFGLTLLVCVPLYYFGGIFAVCATIVMCVLFLTLVISGLLATRLRLRSRFNQPKRNVAFDLPPTRLGRAARSRGRRL
jgi:preprotein translocase subunit SecF